MPNLPRQLELCLSGRVCIMGLGNPDYGDDGCGIRLAEALLDAGVPNVVVAGTTPDRWVAHLSSFDQVVFLDAVEFGGAAGDVVLLDSAEMAARFPQVSTHKISLGLIARWIEADGKTKAWLLGVQPAYLQPSQLSSTVQKTLNAVCELIKAATHVEAPTLGYPEQPDAAGVTP